MIHNYIVLGYLSVWVFPNVYLFAYRFVFSIICIHTEILFQQLYNYFLSHTSWCQSGVLAHRPICMDMNVCPGIFYQLNLVVIPSFNPQYSEAENTAVYNLLSGAADEDKRVWIGLERCGGGQWKPIEFVGYIILINFSSISCFIFGLL